MTSYIRDKNCECAQFQNRDEMSIEDRLTTKNYWMRGVIYKNDIAHECNCHKKWRLSNIYNSVAVQFGLPSYEELKDLKYMGTDDSYKKLKTIPEIIEKNSLKDVLVAIYGRPGCQKTTSLAKLTYNLILNGQEVYYTTFANLIEMFSKQDEKLETFINTDWLLIDDCFEGITVNFKSTYNAFYNLILRRKKPTVLSVDFDLDSIKLMKDKPFYNDILLTKMFTKIDKYHTRILFKENVSKMQVAGVDGNKTIDIWSM